MADAKKGPAKKPAAKGGPQKSNKKARNLYKLYNITDNKIVRKNRTCPKCGTGTFMAAHKDRLVCGQCRYTEYLKK